MRFVQDHRDQSLWSMHFVGESSLRHHREGLKKLAQLFSSCLVWRRRSQRAGLSACEKKEVKDKLTSGALITLAGQTVPSHRMSQNSQARRVGEGSV